MPMRLFSILRVSAKARWRSASLPSPLAGSGRPQWALAVAAILHQEGQEVAGALKIHGIDDRAAVFTRRQQLRARENGDMERQGVVRHLKPPRDVTRRHAVRPALNEQTEDFQAALLCQGTIRPIFPCIEISGNNGARVNALVARRSTARQARQQAIWQGEDAPNSPLGIAPPPVYEGARGKRANPPVLWSDGQKKRISLRENLASLAAHRSLYCLRSARCFG